MIVPRPSLKWLTVIAISAVAVAVSAQRQSAPASPHRVAISFAEARGAIDGNRETLPDSLQGKTDRELEASWPAWVVEHNTEIRRRLQRGDEDSLVNFWLYGTSFTALPRATDRDLAQLGDRNKIAELLEARLDDFVAGISKPGANERLRFARQVVEQSGINLATSTGQDKARGYLIDIRARVIAENDRYRKASQSAAALQNEAEKLNAFSTMFSERGLSSDTSLRPGFAIETALSAIKAAGKLHEVHRLGIVGPGLDFSDKAEGYDFYPQQTIQPFGIVDSLVRLGLAGADDLKTTTFDLSPRVNQHLQMARARAQKGQPYVVQLPLDTKDPDHEWSSELLNYWRHFGDQIGTTVPPLAPPSEIAGLEVRAVSIRPPIVRGIQPRDVNIVLERTDDQPFDLIVATNILVYYNRFDQTLAVTNIASMLRPGGVFLTNYAVPPVASIQPMVDLRTAVFWDRQGNGDTLFWYQRR